MNSAGEDFLSASRGAAPRADRFSPLSLAHAPRGRRLRRMPRLGPTAPAVKRRHVGQHLSLLFNHRGCSWGTKDGWRSGAPLLTQGGH